MRTEVMDRDTIPSVKMEEITIKQESTSSSDMSSYTIMNASELAYNNVEDAAVETKPNPLHIDIGAIPMVPVNNQADELKLLGINVYDQTQFEEGVMKQVDAALEKQQHDVMKRDAKNVTEEIKTIQQRLRHLDRALEMTATLTSTNKDVKRRIEAFRREKDNKERQLKKLTAKHRSLLQRMDGSDLLLTHDDDDEGEDRDIENEVGRIFEIHSSDSKQAELIKTGVMTPFGTIIGDKTTKKRTLVQPTGMSDFDKYLLDQATLHHSKKNQVKRKRPDNETSSSSSTKQNKKQCNDDASNVPSCSKWQSVLPLKPEKKKHSRKKEVLGTLTPGKDKIPHRKNFWPVKEQVIDLDEFANNPESGSDYIPSSAEENDSDEFQLKSEKKKKPRVKMEINGDNDCTKASRSKRVIDDGNQKDYLNRLRQWQKKRLRDNQERIINGEDQETISSSENDYEELDGGYKVPMKIWNKIYKYQKTCVQWLWELHMQRCGGIIGDEMGLGKTIQVISFLAGLWNSNMITRGDSFQGLGPVLIITPTTIMHQWVKEFHTWWPPIRVGILHETGSHRGTKESLIRNMNNAHGVLIMSYTGVATYQHELLRYDWHYIILDEGHKIRNPDARTTLAVKQFRTPHRLILSGSPLQNSLKELWSLFDFIFPGKLGTLPVFMRQFSVPITLGGYANATDIQVQTAYKCATVLRDTISPYLLRRMKADVKMNLNLPSKNEQVLFCRLTDEQRDEYKHFLDSEQVKSIIDGRLKVFVGLIHLRKICNHPDLYSGGPKHFGQFDENLLGEEERYGYWKRSGKMIVIESILKLWHTQNHRVLLFTQSRQMLKILEYFIKTRNYSYMKMDGTTSISSRQPLINQFNIDTSIFIFLLTTRVGGLGVNLTGADRVIIFDPDWNPSTDLQARERAWRIGQNKNVTIYRLLTSGTIEEKIYHRQIFKQFLTNRVLKDPRQRRFFKNNDLYELFTLKEEGKQGPESLALFAGTGSEIKMKALKRKPKPSMSKLKRKETADFIKSSPSKDNLPEKKTSSSNFIPNAAIDETEIKAMKVHVKEEFLVENNSTDMLQEPSSSNAVTQNTTFQNNANIETVTEAPSSLLGAEKLARMKELARQLSQQVASKYRNSSTNSSAAAGKLEISSPAKAFQHKERKNSAKKKRKHALFEGKRIDFLDRQDTFRPSDDPETERINTLKQDEYVLQKLFAKSGVHSALRHDVIVEGADPDYYFVEREANRVAKDAVSALKRSRSSCYQADSGIPNWTGSSQTHPTAAPKLRFGQKKNSSIINFGETLEETKKEMEQGPSTSAAISTPTAPMSSSQLFAKLRERRVSTSDSDEEANRPEANAAPRNAQYDDLLNDLRTFIAFQSSSNGQATTEELLKSFRHKLPPQNSSIFKSLLQRICNFDRNSDGQGIWTLKPEFR